MVEYGNSGGHIQIVPEEPIDVAGLTTLHMSLYRVGDTFNVSRPDGGADLKVKLVYEDATEDDYWFSTESGDEVVPDQWNNVELPLAWMPGSQLEGAHNQIHHSGR